MPVTKDAPGPYAPAATVLTIIDRYRDRGLPVPINIEVLTRAGVPESLIPRVLQTLRIIDLIDDNGMPTAAFEAIRLAPQADLKDTLAKWLQATYADVLQFVDPATASETNLADAFRHYTPQGQRPRMITLFTGLFRAAGIGPEKARSGPDQAAIARNKANLYGTTPKAPRTSSQRTPKQSRETPPPASPTLGLHPALSGLLASLPKWWLKEDKERFMTAFGAVLDLAVPVVEAAPPAVEGANDGFGS